MPRFLTELLSIGALLSHKAEETRMLEENRTGLHFPILRYHNARNNNKKMVHSERRGTS